MESPLMLLINEPQIRPKPTFRRIFSVRLPRPGLLSEPHFPFSGMVAPKAVHSHRSGYSRVQPNCTLIDRCDSNRSGAHFASLTTFNRNVLCLTIATALP